MSYTLAIFDLDGTILDTLDDLNDSLNAALTACGMPGRTREETCRFVGNGIRKLIERAVPTGSTEADVDRLFDAFTSYYKTHSAIRTRPYDGIPEMLQDLRAAGCKLAVVSNKADFAVQDLCAHYYPGLLDAVFGENEKAGIRKKPAPDSVNAVLRKLGIDRSSAVFVGDSDVDIETAKNAGMPCISVDWGFRDTDFLNAHGATCIVSTTDELKAKILES